MILEEVLVRWLEMIATTYPGALLRCERPSGEVLFLKVRDASTILVYRCQEDRGAAEVVETAAFPPMAVIRWENGRPRLEKRIQEVLGDITSIRRVVQKPAGVIQGQGWQYRAGAAKRQEVWP